MTILPQQIFTISSLILIFQTWVVLGSTYCNSVCSSKSTLYPFGFSEGCKIKLNCSETGEIKIGDFPVQSFSPNGIKVSIEPDCNRPMKAIDSLFGHNYAPTSGNGILLHNCSQILTCLIPTTAIQARFELPECSRGASDSLSCYTETDLSREFLDYKNLGKNNCGSMFSGISAQKSSNGTSLGSLEVQVVELGFWLEGQCKCSQNANCIRVVSPVTGKNGFRCQCYDGYFGDGYADGYGCQKADFSDCRLFPYFLSIRCGGLIKLGALVGGIAIGASVISSICCCIRRRRNEWNVKTQKISKRTVAASDFSIPIYAYKDIEKATNGFSDKQRLGTGGWGIVYSAKLQNGGLVAIKRMKYRGNESVKQVMNEIKLISSVNHPNLVGLLGCSIENGEQILVYEFMPNGTLSQHLHRERGDGLGWACRLDEIIDPFIEAEKDDWAMASVHKVAELAFRCLAFHRDMRPTMMEVAAELEQIGLTRWASSEESSCRSSSSCGSARPISMKVKDRSSVSVQDSWLSVRSSLSSKPFDWSYDSPTRLASA
ncbi:Serine-threonine/tyrosine-protein kinase, catalytic domain, partial [Dillenia turbinata]